MRTLPTIARKNSRQIFFGLRGALMFSKNS